MSNVKMFCDALPNIPWQEKPASCSAPVWRYTECYRPDVAVQREPHH